MQTVLRSVVILLILGLALFMMTRYFGERYTIGETYQLPSDSLTHARIGQYQSSRFIFVRDSTAAAIKLNNLTTHIIPETKDLAKDFLTLAVAVLVASITFSEKVINFQTAGYWARAFMISTWSTIIFSIIFCGVGILLLMDCEGYALYTTARNAVLYPYYFAIQEYKPAYVDTESQSFISFFIAGSSFTCSLILLMITSLTASNKVTPADSAKYVPSH